MSVTEKSFAGEVRQALENIPHHVFCNAAPHKIVRSACDCDREERIAEAVARAIEAAQEFGGTGIKPAFLGALSGVGTGEAGR